MRLIRTAGSSTMCVARCGTLVTQAQCHGATQDTDTIIKVSSECSRPACSSSAALCVMMIETVTQIQRPASRQLQQVEV